MSRDWQQALLIRDHLPETDSWLQTFHPPALQPRTLGQRVLMSGDGMSGGVSVEQSQFPAPLLLTWCSRSGADHTWERSRAVLGSDQLTLSCSLSLSSQLSRHTPRHRDLYECCQGWGAVSDRMPWQWPDTSTTQVSSSGGWRMISECYLRMVENAVVNRSWVSCACSSSQLGVSRWFLPATPAPRNSLPPTNQILQPNLCFDQNL